jgi:hypothetical protein
MKVDNEENKGQDVKAVTFKLQEPRHNLDGANCGVHIALQEGKTVQLK